MVEPADTAGNRKNYFPSDDEVCSKAEHMGATDQKDPFIKYFNTTNFKI